MDSTQDSMPWIPDSSYWIPNSLKVGLGFRIPIVRRIRDSLTCIPDSTSKNFPDSGIWIPLHRTWGEIYKQNVSEMYSNLYLPLLPFRPLLLVYTWRHGGHFGSQEQKHFSPLGSKLHFCVNSLRKNSIVLTTNMAASSRGCKPRNPPLFS